MALSVLLPIFLCVSTWTSAGEEPEESRDVVESLNRVADRWKVREASSVNSKEVNLFRDNWVSARPVIIDALQSDNANSRRCAGDLLWEVPDSTFSKDLSIAIASEDVRLTKIYLLHAMAGIEIPRRFPIFLRNDFERERDSGVKATIAGVLMIAAPAFADEDVIRYFLDGLTLPEIGQPDHERLAMTLHMCKRLEKGGSGALEPLRALTHDDRVNSGLQTMASEAVDNIERALKME